MSGLYRRNPYRDLGRYTIANGRHDIQFEMDYSIQTVLISCNNGAVPVCSGDIDWLSITVIDNGFIIHADVKSDSIDIVWVTVEQLI